MKTADLLETIDRVKRAWELVGSSAPLERQAILRQHAQQRLENEWPSLAYAVRHLADSVDPASLYLDLAQTHLVDAETKLELIAAYTRMYERNRAAGVSEQDSLRAVLERAL